MQKISLSNERATVALSKIVLGTGSFGTSIPTEVSFALLDRYREFGGFTIDTARVYGAWGPDGRSTSEEAIGAWLRSRGCRNEVTLVTKGAHPPLGNMQQSRLSEQEIRSDIEGSLLALGTDRVDVYLLHRDDTALPVEEIVDTLDRLVREGKTLMVGVSNWSVKRILEANAYAEKTGKTKLAVSQIQWSFAQTTPQLLGDTTLTCMSDEEYIQYRRINMPVMAYSSQASGFFTKWMRDGEESLNDGLRRHYLSEENRKRFERLRRFCEETGCSPTTAALAYITHNPLPGAAIIGCNRLEQLEDSLAESDRLFDEDALRFLFDAE